MDAKLCYSVPDDAQQINETEVYVAFMDRFYTVPETAIIALAVNRSGSGPFTILGFVNGAIVELDLDPPIMMARLITFADRQVRHAFATRRTLPKFVIQQELSIPEVYADLGDRQLNEILSNTRYHVRRRHACDNFQDQFKVAKAFESRSDVRDAPGRSRGRSVPAQPLTLPITSRPKARPRTESPSGPNVRQRVDQPPSQAPPLTSYATRNSTAHVFDNLGYEIDPGQPRQPHFTRLDSLQWARLKAARDPRVPQGLESQAIPKFEDLNDYVILGADHADYYLAGWAEYNVRGERVY